jgi:hypothetical protein
MSTTVTADPDEDWHGCDFSGDTESNCKRQREVIEKSDRGAAEEPEYTVAGGNSPKAEARRSIGTIGATAAGIIDSCTPIPSPHCGSDEGRPEAPQEDERRK